MYHNYYWNIIIWHSHPERRIDKACARPLCFPHNPQHIFFSIFEKGQNRHQQDARKQSSLTEPGNRIKPAGRGRCTRFHFRGEGIVTGGDRDFAEYRRLQRNPLQDVHVPFDQAALGRDRCPESVRFQQFECMAGQLQLLFKRIVRVTHCTGPNHPLPHLAPQIVPDDAQCILLGAHPIEPLDLIAVTPAVTIDAPMATASVDVHIVVDSKPASRCLSAGDDRFSGDVFDHFSVFHRLRVGKYVSICCFACSRSGYRPASSPIFRQKSTICSIVQSARNFPSL